MKTLAKMYRGQYRVIGDVLETWKADHEEAMAVGDLEEVIEICIGLNQRCGEIVKKAFSVGFSGKMRNPEEVGGYVLKALKAGSETWKEIDEAIKEAIASGYSVNGTDRIPA